MMCVVVHFYHQKRDTHQKEKEEKKLKRIFRIIHFKSYYKPSLLPGLPVRRALYSYDLITRTGI